MSNTSAQAAGKDSKEEKDEKKSVAIAVAPQNNETFSRIIQQNNAALQVALQGLLLGLAEIDSKLIGDRRETLRETIDDMLARFEVANDIGFMNLEPLITSLKFLDEKVYVAFGYQCRYTSDNFILVLRNYIAASIGCKVRQKILPGTVDVSAASAEIEKICFARNSGGAAVDAVEKFWRMSMPKSAYTREMNAFDADGTAICACKRDGFDVDDCLWRGLIDGLSVYKLTEVVSASWRICWQSDIKSARETKSVEFFPYIKELAKRIAALGYPFKFNPALLTDFQCHQEPGLHISSKERYAKQTAPLHESYPDKFIIALWHMHCFNNEADAILYKIFDDADFVAERFKYVLPKVPEIVPRNTTIQVHKFCAGDARSVQEPVCVLSGTGDINRQICDNANFLLRLSSLADLQYHPSLGHYWINQFNERFRLTLTAIVKNMRDKKINLSAEEGRQKFFEIFAAAESQSLHCDYFHYIDLYDLLEFICSGWRASTPNTKLPEWIAITYPYLAGEMSVFFNGLAVYLYTVEELKLSSEKDELDAIMLANDPSLSRKRYAEFKTLADRGDLPAKWKMAYLLSQDEKSLFASSQDRFTLMEKCYVPVMIDEKEAVPVDIIWSLVLAYYQREVSSFNVFLLMEKFCYCLNSLSEKFIQEKFFSAKTNLASASSSAARSGYSGAFFTATFEEEACDCDQSAAATTETVSPAAESKGDAPQSLFFAGSQNDSNDNSQINSSRGPGPGSKDTPQATNAVVSVVVANPVA